LDTVAWFARSMEDVELLFDVMAVQGANYPYVNEKVKREAAPKKIRLGYFRGPKWNFAADYAQRAIEESVNQLRKTNAFVVEEVQFPEAAEIYDIHELIYCKALSYYFRGEERNTRDSISQVLVDMLDKGEKTTPAAYHAAVKRQAELTTQFNDRFSYDAWITLSSAGEAPVGLRTPDKPDTCKIWTYLGLPALSLPVFSSPSGLPFGMQVIGSRYSDYKVFDAGKRICQFFGKSKAPLAQPLKEAVPTHG
jgi:Asp-tRNA(Asn)/Glu-tRNA(Gln) amidotransferase A subunit family amidase